MLGCTLLAGACSDKEEGDTGKGTGSITISLPSCSQLTGSGIVLTAQAEAEEKAVAQRGFCYATTPDVDIDHTLAGASGTGKMFTASLKDLKPNTSYYVKAFITTKDNQTVYSPELVFTTLSRETDELLANYTAPDYPDNYLSVAEWSKRSEWNLSNVHDPTIMKADDGYFYMYQTDASYGNVHNQDVLHGENGHFYARRSRDLVHWEYLGATMRGTPAWVKEKLNELRLELGLLPIGNPSHGYWAPVARNLGSGTYRMYYSIVTDHYIQSGNKTGGAFENSWTERSFIGMMETTDPAGNQWEDKGYVICSSTDRGLNWWRDSASDWNGYFKWNAIDPTYIITKEGEHWLIYGSWHSGITAVQVDATTGKPLGDLGVPWKSEYLSGYGQLIHTRNIHQRWQGSEAPEIIYNPETDYYYLFMAYDELSVAYNTRVARSKNITGPYLGINGVNVTTGADIYPVITHPYKFINGHGWVGISHCAVFEDGAGNWFYASQGRLPKDIPQINASNALMMGHIRSIRWTQDGWPLVMPQRYGATPLAKITLSELIGDWEHIDLEYSYGQQKEASLMTLAGDYQITAGTWKGNSWSFDEEKQILTANGIDLYLQRETDWEANPRKHTIVYAGYTTTKTYWGKRNRYLHDTGETFIVTKLKDNEKTNNHTHTLFPALFYKDMGTTDSS
ncbi:MAG: arabinan endo-1,5-alpha-L-arabinosidase [Bacteroides sp.]|nr:arabinan endo-1,5-alpha-L-arabinosidase [Bacteroides sp.]